MAPPDSPPRLGSPFAWRRRDGLTSIVAPLDGAEAIFSTRAGGVSDGPYASLNVGILSDDDPTDVDENRRRLAAAAGLDPGRVALGWQTHGSRIRYWPAAPAGGLDARGSFLDKVDGHATAERGLGLLVLVADCVPVALIAPGSVAMLHCGWRGLLEGIVGRGVAAVQAAVPGPPGGSQVTALIGPSIGRCCYELGEEVIEMAVERGHGAAVDGGSRLDLVEVVRRDLARAGVDRDRVHATGLCTSCHPELFFSHRRDGGQTGRQGGLVWLR